jgi:hypothetical protein
VGRILSEAMQFCACIASSSVRYLYKTAWPSLTTYISMSRTMSPLASNLFSPRAPITGGWPDPMPARALAIPSLGLNAHCKGKIQFSPFPLVNRERSGLYFIGRFHMVLKPFQAQAHHSTPIGVGVSWVHHHGPPRTAEFWAPVEVAVKMVATRKRSPRESAPWRNVWSRPQACMAKG